MSAFECTEGEKRFLAICVAARRSPMRDALADAMSPEEAVLFRKGLTTADDLYARLMGAARRDAEAGKMEACPNPKCKDGKVLVVPSFIGFPTFYEPCSYCGGTNSESRSAQ